MPRLRFRIVRLFLCLGFAAVLTRLAYVQLWCHDELAQKAEHQSQRWIREAPRRGPILDRHGRVLTHSVRVASCYADPTLIRNPAKIAALLSGPLQAPARSLEEKIRRAPGAFVWLKRSLSVEQAQAVEKMNLFGVGLQWGYERAYPNGDLAAHLVGLVGVDGNGLSGVELACNDILIDRRPPRRALRDGRGAGLADGPVEDDDDEDRSWARLSIDQTIQYIAERELDWGMQRSRARNGLIVVQDPWTGEILAMASRPNLPLDRRRPLKPHELAIPAVQNVFEPGSTFKAVTAAAALEEKVVFPSETFDCENGDWKIQGMTIHDHEKEGVLTFRQVIERSSNIGTAKVGMRLGKIRLYDYARAFGFGSPTGTEIPGEAAGLLKPPAKWSGVSLPVISFGQEVGVTAVQLASLYSAIANGGTLLEPRVYQETCRVSDERRTWPAPSPVRRVISQESAEKLKKILEGVVAEGTGHPAQLEGWSVAGKTGTAQKVDPATHRYSPDRYIASFCGFAPAVKPRLTIVVVYDEPQGISWGGYNAGPVFKNVAWHVLTYFGVPPDQDVRVAAGKAKKPARAL